MHVYGLLITKNDHEAFADWCRDQLPLYERVVCLDGSDTDATEVDARSFSDRLIYRHEREFDIPSKSDHGLRGMAHQELVRLFGHNIWIMCCHTDEFCYHDPCKIAARAEHEGFDLVSWFSPHFYPHPSELADVKERMRRPVQGRFRHYHWGYLGTGLPWIEDRLYFATAGVEWDATTHGSVRPHGLKRPAPFHPIYRHFKVCGIDLAGFEPDGESARYRGHWEQQPNRTGLPFRVDRLQDLFVTAVPQYSFCNRFVGRFDHPWNIGDQFSPDARSVIPSALSIPKPPTIESPISALRGSTRSRRVIAFGPRMPDFGSWQWVGADIADELSKDFDVRIFDREIPPADLVVFVKFKPEPDVVRRISHSSAVIYCPIDVYGSSGEIDADAAALGACDRVLIHCERLRKYFTAYAPVEYIDHHVKFSAPMRSIFITDGPILWVGVRSNLPPLVEWVNRQHLPDELWILTNPENPTEIPRPDEVGFQPHNRIRIERWSAERQREWTTVCRGALDIKGDDFRARHKPPAKSIDFLASGIPIALQPDSSAAEYYSHRGFKSANLDDVDRWRSHEYWQEVRRFGTELLDLLSRERIGRSWSRIIYEVLVARDSMHGPDARRSTNPRL